MTTKSLIFKFRLSSDDLVLAQSLLCKLPSAMPYIGLPINYCEKKGNLIDPNSSVLAHSYNHNSVLCVCISLSGRVANYLKISTFKRIFQPLNSQLQTDSACVCVTVSG